MRLHPFLFLASILSFSLLLIPAPTEAQVKDDEIRDALLPWIQHEVGLKNIPSLSIALVDDQRVVFAASVGHADPKTKAPATPDSLYRVGSVSKPFTAILLMILVELGMIDL